MTKKYRLDVRGQGCGLSLGFHTKEERAARAQVYLGYGYTVELWETVR